MLKMAWGRSDFYVVLTMILYNTTQRNTIQYNTIQYNTIQYNTIQYRMAKIYCHINHCNASVQYFAILHAHKYCTMSRKHRRLKTDTHTLTFIPKSKRCSAIQQSLRQKVFVSRHMSIVARQNSCVVRQKNLAIR